MNKLRFFFEQSFFWLLFINPQVVIADSEVNFHGTLVVVQCQVNQDQEVKVQFNNVGVKKVDGVNYETAIPFAITCNNMGSDVNPALTLNVKSSVSDFDENAVATDADGLAIKIKINGEALDLNTDIAINYPSLPALTAVPVKKAGVDLTARPFHATATLVVNVA